ncbi:MAG TPA: phage portal protein [Xanthobacteraceae bacterium]|jgi:lambda family phage portal protein|nr:phage portal protein [Xanthobacteraceae bacterium]
MPTFRQRLKAAIAGFANGGRARPQYPAPISMRALREGQKRSYAGAIYDRLTEDWKSPLTTGDAEMRTRLRTLRGRARELERNEPYSLRYLSRLEDNIYDFHGITFNSMAGEWRKDPKTQKLAWVLDEMDSAIIQDAYARWKRDCFVSGDMSLNEGGRLALRSTARDGDMVVKKIVDSSNEFGCRLQLLEADMIDDMRNEVIRVADQGNGGRVLSEVRMGVQVNGYMRPEGYWILKAHPGDQMWWNTDGYLSEFHPAKDFIHPFKRQRITQVRDCTWLHGIMRDLKMLDGYDEAAIVAARTGAAKMGFFTRGYNEPGDGYTGEQPKDGDKTMDSEPGLIEDLSGTPGLDFKQWDPAYPHEQYDDFMKVRLRRIGAGLDMSYYAIANDLTEVNFSSIRAGLLEDREHFKALQTWWIYHFETPVFLFWLNIALANGSMKDPTTGRALPYSKKTKFEEHRFRPRRWPWVDPEKDAQANKIAVDNRFKSRDEVIQETSQTNFEEVVAQQGREQQQAEKFGVELPPAADSQPEKEPDGDEGGEAKGGKKPKKDDRNEPTTVLNVNVATPTANKRIVAERDPVSRRLVVTQTEN